ncbi:LamG-like jellyroll fold domain-containing protein [Demequina gelatinilytica]|uniref:LamG-like jellyroll fold domain-containing protein n=1 Tax=Demequina gelatinilytica TaxID=1638980 RepID=UPI000785C70D|nr:family 43 glycosylhydrolase [Demequina gelatinilytica]
MARPQPHRRIVAGATCLAGIAGIAFTGSAASANTGDPAPTFTDVTVHDPSIVTSGDDIWVFGSHGASAYTTDLMNWTQNSVDLSQDADNPLFEDIYTELAETFAWAETSTLWASDVIQLADGRYYLYYNACEGSSPRSAMGLAVSDSVDGPYTNVEVFLKSGWTDEEKAELGITYDATQEPNAVDPDAFYDADGNLWLVYGSYSGGIFILELDPETGLPLADQGWGTHLLGGNHARIEGATIRYDEETGYYYLFTSFGGLGADGGYEVRVSRSASPDGPYVDAEGNLMAEAKGAEGTLFDDVSIADFGTQLLDGHLWEREVGDPGTGDGTGYVSPGHNSWYDDPDTGESFLVFHSRFPSTGETHHVRVQQMYMNEDGWPVLAPFRYAGETLEPVAAEDLEGEWQVILSDDTIEADVNTPVAVTLASDGSVSGALTGTWELAGDNDVTLSTGAGDFVGLAAPAWDPDREQWETTLTATVATGETLWARPALDIAGADAVAAVVADLDLGDTSAVVSRLTLPTTGTGGTTITWSSTDEAHLAADGTVTRPGAGEDDATVTLTAVVTNGEASQTLTFTVVVLARPDALPLATWSFEDSLDDNDGAFATPTVTGSLIGTTGGSVSYVPDGVEGSALHLDGASGVELGSGLIQGDTYSVSMWLRPEALTSFTTAFFAASSGTEFLSVVPLGWNGGTMLWSNDNGSWYDGVTDQLIPVDEWTHVAFTVDEGTVTLYVDGEDVGANTAFNDVLTSPSAVFTLGVNWWDTPYQGDIDQLAMWTSVLTAEQVADLEDPLAAGTVEVTGTAQVGQTLTASTAGWREGASLSYQWLVDGVAVDGATDATFVPSLAGQPVSVAVTASMAGHASATATSDEVEVVPGVLEAGTVEITGTAKVGSRLTAATADWPENATLSYQWRIAGKAVEGATDPSWRPTAAALGQKVSVKVTATLDGFTSASKASKGVVVSAGTMTAGTVEVVRAPIVGRTVAAATAGWPKGAAKSYEWRVGGEVVKGATGRTLTVTKAMTGKRIWVKVTATKDGYAAVSRRSAKSAPVQ